MPDLIDIGPATLEKARPDLFIVRFKPGALADGDNLQISVVARREHSAGTPHVALLIAPEDSDFAPSILGHNQYMGTGAENFTRALAVVCPNPTVRNILELYFAMHLVSFPVQFFDAEKAGLEWALAQCAPTPRCDP